MKHPWTLADMPDNMGLGAFTHEVRVVQRFSDVQIGIQTFPQDFPGHPPVDQLSVGSENCHQSNFYLSS